MYHIIWLANLSVSHHLIGCLHLTHVFSVFRSNPFPACLTPWGPSTDLAIETLIKNTPTVDWSRTCKQSWTSSVWSSMIKYSTEIGMNCNCIFISLKITWLKLIEIMGLLATHWHVWTNTALVSNILSVLGETFSIQSFYSYMSMMIKVRKIIKYHKQPSCWWIYFHPTMHNQLLTCWIVSNMITKYIQFLYHIKVFVQHKKTKFTLNKPYILQILYCHYHADGIDQIS